jgi:hypothetical protein
MKISALPVSQGTIPSRYGDLFLNETVHMKAMRGKSLSSTHTGRVRTGSDSIAKDLLGNNLNPLKTS